MQIEERAASVEKRVVTAMIVDVAVLAKISARWNKDLFKSEWSREVASWCVEYFQKYGKAPGPVVESLFTVWAGRTNDEDTVAIVRKFLRSLSKQYAELRKNSNTQFILDLAGEYFSQVQLERLRDSLEDYLLQGKLDKAIQQVQGFDRADVASSDGVRPFEQQEIWKAAYESKREPLIQYPGALGAFFGDSLERDGFISLMAPEKRGKTWMLIELAMRAASQGRRVAFFAVGDMSESQMLRRFGIWLTKVPKTPRSIQWPTFLEYRDEDRYATVTHEKQSHTRGCDLKMSWRAVQKFVKKKGIDSRSLMLRTAPNSSLNVMGIRAQLQTWDREFAWSPDVIVVDYADILAPPSGVADTRDQINATWKQLRALSQERHCLVVTATQTDADSYDAPLLKRSNFSEDKRKYAHVTGMFGINCSEMEKRQGLWRLNWLVLREGDFDETKCVHVAGCLAVGRPVVLSTF